MKKILGIISITVLIFSNSANAGKWGEGELQLTKSMADYFIQFIRGKGNKSPADFYVTLDGIDAMYWYCSAGSCKEGSSVQDIKDCEFKTGKKCKKFAFRRTIKWKNGINSGKYKESTINSKWSDTEIYAKLTELGFYNNDFSKKVEPKITKKAAGSSSDLTKELKELKELLDSEILTQDEFTELKENLLKKYKE